MRTEDSEGGRNRFFFNMTIEPDVVGCATTWVLVSIAKKHPHRLETPPYGVHWLFEDFPAQSCTGQ